MMETYQYIVFNRKTNFTEHEVSGNVSGLHFLYRTIPGRLLSYLMVRRFISRFYGWYVKRPKSVRLIDAFIKQYNIDITEVKGSPDSFSSLNDFFVRRLKPEARPVDPSPESLISPADARLLVYDLAQQGMLPVKGYWYALSDFLQHQALVKAYSNAWCLVYRLAPCDYHRFHYIDDGRQDSVVRIPGVLHSVNPIALSAVNTLLAKNYREVTVLHTSHFGKVVQTEVGALMVGRIVQHNNLACSFKRGDEKGWFEFGGSTIVQLIHKDVALPDADLLERSRNGLETLVRMGERVGCAS